MRPCFFTKLVCNGPAGYGVRQQTVEESQNNGRLRPCSGWVNYLQQGMYESARLHFNEMSSRWAGNPWPNALYGIGWTYARGRTAMALWNFVHLQKISTNMAVMRECGLPRCLRGRSAGRLMRTWTSSSAIEDRDSGTGGV